MTRSARLLCAAGVAVAGCVRNEPPTTPPPAELAQIAAIAAPAPAAPVQTVAPAPAAAETKPEPPKVTVELPADAGGAAVAKLLAGGGPPAPAFDKTPAPKPRTAAADRAEPPLIAVSVALPPTPMPPGKLAKPSPPPERPVPVLAGGNDLLPTLALSPRPPRTVANPAPPLTAADLGRLAVPTGNRAPLDDPTTDLSASRLIRTALPVPEPSAGGLRASVPDPFEFAAQVRGPLPVTGELGTAPVTVPAAK